MLLDDPAPNAPPSCARSPPRNASRCFAAFAPAQREEILALTLNPAAVPTTELLDAKLLREIYSNRQLQEVMTDFWLNHFNIFINKRQERYLLTSFERDAIRPHALGKFKDLLIATATSPAMLFYLDNAESIGPDSDFARRGGRKPQPRDLAKPSRRASSSPSAGSRSAAPLRTRPRRPRKGRSFPASTKTTPANSWSCTPSA